METINNDTYGEVHVTLQDGRTIYWPKGDISRYAPAAVCQVSSRIKLLRKALKNHEMDAGLRRELERLTTPLPYEAEWDSQCSITVHNAIKQLGNETNKHVPCPVCGEELTELIYPGGYLNEEQWRANLAGDYVCKKCPDNERGTMPYAYYWKSELTPTRTNL